MKNKNTRKSQILINNKWVDTLALDIKIGDKFRMFEDDETPVIDTRDNITTEWIALSDGYTNENGVYCIDID